MKNITFIAMLVFTTNVYASQIFECDYTNYSDQKGNHKVTGSFMLKFVVDENGKSYMVGNNGRSEVVYLDRGNRISFVEITGLGNVMSTAIDNKLNSVHSRNSVMFDKLIPSQYYGKCVIK